MLQGASFGNGDRIPIRKGFVTIVRVMVPQVSDRPYQVGTPSKTEPLRPSAKGQFAGACREAGIYGVGLREAKRLQRRTNEGYDGLKVWLLGRDLNPQPSG